MWVKKAPVTGTKMAGRSVVSGGMSFWRPAVEEGVGGFGVDIFSFFLGELYRGFGYLMVGVEELERTGDEKACGMER